MQGEYINSHPDFEMIESNTRSSNEKKFEKLKEKRYRNRTRESILTYEMMISELESQFDGSSYWVMPKKKSEDDINLATNKKNIIPERKRENKSEEKENNNIDLKIRKSILINLNNKIKNFDNTLKKLENTEDYKSKEDVFNIKNI